MITCNVRTTPTRSDVNVCGTNASWIGALGLIVTVYWWVSDEPVESATRRVNVTKPTVSGAPVIARVLAFRLNPLGRVLETRLKVRGPVPPLVATVWA